MDQVAIIIDADTLLYRIGFQYLGTDALPYIGAVSTYLDNVINDCHVKINSTWGGEYEPVLHIIFSGEGKRYREQFDKESVYKQARWNAPKPKFISEMKTYIASEKFPSCTYFTNTEWGEADDFVSHRAWTLRKISKRYVIAGCDKDLLQIPGWHYNYLKKTFREYSMEEANKFFFKQLLMGDRGDSIPGIPKIGTKKADWLLDGLYTSEEMWDAVLSAYTNFYAPHGYTDDDIAEMLYERGNKLWLKRRHDEIWTPPMPTED